MKVLLILLLISWSFTLLLWVNFKIKEAKTRKEWEQKINAIIRQNSANTKAKESMETGNSVNDFNASLDVLSHLKK